MLKYISQRKTQNMIKNFGMLLEENQLKSTQLLVIQRKPEMIQTWNTAFGRFQMRQVKSNAQRLLKDLFKEHIWILTIALFLNLTKKSLSGSAKVQILKKRKTLLFTVSLSLKLTTNQLVPVFLEYAKTVKILTLSHSLMVFIQLPFKNTVDQELIYLLQLSKIWKKLLTKRERMLKIFWLS